MFHHSADEARWILADALGPLNVIRGTHGERAQQGERRAEIQQAPALNKARAVFLCAGSWVVLAEADAVEWIDDRRGDVHQMGRNAFEETYVERSGYGIAAFEA